MSCMIKSLLSFKAYISIRDMLWNVFNLLLQIYFKNYWGLVWMRLPFFPPLHWYLSRRMKSSKWHVKKYVCSYIYRYWIERTLEITKEPAVVFLTSMMDLWIGVFIMISWVISCFSESWADSCYRLWSVRS